MAVLFDDDVLAYQLIAVPVSTSRAAGYTLYFSCPEVQLTNIRLWGVGIFYRIRTAPIGTVPTQLQRIDLRAPHVRFSGLEVAATGVQDGVQFIPTYDLARVVIYDNLP